MSAAIAASVAASNTLATTDQRLRTDIQILRGLAVILVVLQHFGIFTPLKAGYLGVDIFFVVSGYLITGIIQRDIHAGSFSFMAFYTRRAKRLLPAAYVTFVATGVAATVFLNRGELKDFAWQLFGAVTFTGNVALWLQTGYFEPSAQLKPLLHIWSLSVEEQYYALLPLALVFTPRRWWARGAVGATALSIALCLALVVYRPGAAFYLLPTRAWELGLGSITVMLLDGSAAGAWIARLFWLAFLSLLILPFYPTGAPHPGLDALIVCIATVVIILRRHPIFELGLFRRGVARIGDISYSLYLVHWPLLAFAANAWLTPVPYSIRLQLLLLAMGTAWALYHLVEQPFRRKSVALNRTVLALLLGVSVLLASVGFVALRLQLLGDTVDYAHQKRGNFGLNVACEFGDSFSPKPECRTSVTPGILLWGDSYAMHLAGGIAATTDIGLVQATKTTCGPLLSISVFRTTDFYNRAWAAACLRFNHSVMDYLVANDSVQVVILSSLLEQYLPGNRLLLEHGGSAMEGNASLIEVSGSQDIAAAHLQQTIATLRALDRRVVIVAPTPHSNFDVGRCLERTALDKVLFGADTPDCQISHVRDLSHRAEVNSLLKRVALESNVPVFDLSDYLCTDGKCMVNLDGTALYRDAGHLSEEGGIVLARRLDLANRLMALAK